MKKFGKITEKFKIIKNIMDYNTQKSIIWGIYLFCDSFEPENESVCPLKPVDSIAKVLTFFYE